MRKFFLEKAGKGPRTKPRALFAIILILASSLSAGLSYWYAQSISAPSIGATIEPGIQFSCGWTIYRDGVSYLAWKGSGGGNSYSGTNALTIIQNALDNGGGLVCLMGKNTVYDTTSGSLTIPSQSGLIGETSTTQLLVPSNGIKNADQTNGNVDITIARLHIKSSASAAIFFDKVTRARILDVKLEVTGAITTAAQIHRSSFVEWYGGEIRPASVGIQFAGTTDTIVKGVQFIDNGDDAIDITTTAGIVSSRITVAGNQFLHPTITTGGNIRLEGAATFITITFNLFDTSDNFGIGQDSGGVTASNHLYSNNMFRNQRGGAITMSGLSNGLVSGNHIVNTIATNDNTGGIALTTANVAMQNITITHNQIIGAGFRTGTTSGGIFANVNTNAMNRLVIANNVVRSSNPFAIAFFGSNIATSAVQNNDLIGNTGTIQGLPTGVTTRYNLGYVTENWGGTSMADGGTISHGLAGTPDSVTVTCSIASQICGITALAATTFTVSIKTDAGAAGTTQTVYWYAVFIP